MKLQVSSSPHITGGQTTQKIMLHVIIALMPAVFASFFIFGIYPIISIILCVSSCVLAELLFNLITKQTPTVKDGSAVVTGIILGLNLPPVLPLYIPVIGGFFAILVVKMLFGGLGRNFANPALTARIFLVLAWTAAMTTFVAPINLELGGGELVKYFTMPATDALSGATPLASLKAGDMNFDFLSMFLGSHGGAAGEVSVLAILIGGAYLIVMKVIDARIPLAVVGSTVLFSLIFYGDGAAVLPAILGGGLMFGAFFMATDYATSPNTTAGKIIFATGIGFLTVLFRRYGDMTEGVSFAIVIMNIIVPLLDKYIVPTAFGEKNLMQKLKIKWETKNERKKQENAD